MITRVSMKDYKVFEDEKLDLSYLNILTGLNSSGKSSVIQALRLLYEGSPLSSMGSLKGYIRYESRNSHLSCNIVDGANEKVAQFTFSRDGKFSAKNKDVFNSNGIVSYISADRYGPRTTLPLDINNDINVVGHYGEHIVDFLQLLETEPFEAMRTPETLAINGEIRLQANIREWLRKISPGIELAFKTDEHADLGRIEWDGFRPTHVGFGLSYTLPIIASVLTHTAQLISRNISYALLLIENPEAHLHPAGQTMMGQLLALAASCGVQIVVETHSDHLLNGVRVAVKEKLLSHDHVRCFFFKVPDTDKKTITRQPAYIERIRIDTYGMLDNWPESFFDETEKNLLRLV